MAFLNASMLGKVAATSVATEAHPILKNGEISLDVKRTYLRGCVFAALMCDESMGATVHDEIASLGRSLRLDEGVVEEDIGLVSGLKEDSDKTALVAEVVDTMKADGYRAWFIFDFERIMRGGASLAPSAVEVLHFFSTSLFGASPDWRQEVWDKLDSESLKRDYIACCTAAAKEGDPLAQTLVGICYVNGVCVSKDADEAKKWLRKAAEQGFAKAQMKYASALCDSEDEGVVAEGVQWCTKAATQGYLEAQQWLGIMYSLGLFVEKDDNKSFEWYHNAAKQGDSISQNAVGLCYLNGCGVMCNPKKAAEWFHKAAKQGDMNAQNNLAEMYENGTGVDADVKLSLEWRMKAAEQGHGAALFALAFSYWLGTDGVDQNNGRAFEYASKGASIGDLDSQWLLGNLYLNGEGVQEDQRKSFEWFLKSAEQGYAASENMVGMAYSNGRGVQTDLQKAFEWFKKAAEHGDAAAQGNLAVALQEGQGCRRNKKEAVEWFRKAAEQGNSFSANRLGLCYAEGIGVEQDEEVAIKWFRIAAEGGEPLAYYNLGLSLQNYSEATDRDYRESLSWLSKAVDEGIDGAQEALDNAYDPDDDSTQTDNNGGGGLFSQIWNWGSSKCAHCGATITGSIATGSILTCKRCGGRTRIS